MSDDDRIQDDSGPFPYRVAGDVATPEDGPDALAGQRATNDQERARAIEALRTARAFFLVVPGAADENGNPTNDIISVFETTTAETAQLIKAANQASHIIAAEIVKLLGGDE